MSKICNECGRPVALGSGRFLSRVLDLHLVEERRAYGKPYPEGGLSLHGLRPRAVPPDRCPTCSGKAAGAGPGLRVKPGGARDEPALRFPEAVALGL